jgi:hypothetical protein
LPLNIIKLRHRVRTFEAFKKVLPVPGQHMQGKTAAPLDQPMRKPVRVNCDHDERGII